MKKPNKLVIGITGGFATGKSTVTSYLRSKHYKVICADEISRDATKSPRVLKRISNVFGPKFILKNGNLNRAKMAAHVFTNKNELAKLEKIIHPFVRSQIFKALKKNQGLLFVDIPLLFENGWERYFDVVICVSANRQHQLERAEKHRGVAAQDTRQRLKNQLPLSQKRALADYVIHNKDTLKALHEKTDRIIQKIVRLHLK